MPEDHDPEATRLVERLLRDPAFRRRFRQEPVGSCALLGLEDIALRLHAHPASHQGLEPRELRSSVAGVVLAAAVESVAIEQAVVAYGTDGIDAVRGAAGEIDLHTVGEVIRGGPEPLPPSGPIEIAPLPGQPVAPPAGVVPPVPVTPDPLWTPEVTVASQEAAAAAASAPAFGVFADGDYPGDAASSVAVAQWMAAGAQAAQLPPELPVMAALTESNLTNLPYGDADSVGFFQMRTSVWNHGPYAGYLRHPDRQLEWFVDHAVAVRDRMIASGAGDPTDDPDRYGEWIANVERPAAQYRERYLTHLEDARTLLGASPLLTGAQDALTGHDASGVVPDVGILPGDNGEAQRLAAEVLASPDIALDPAGMADLAEGRIDGRISAVLLALGERHPITVSVLETGHSRLTTGGSVSNHSVGRGVDISVVDGTPVTPGNRTALLDALFLNTLPAEYRPSEIGSPWLPDGAAYFTDGHHQDHLHIGFDDPAQPDLVDVEPSVDAGVDGASTSETGGGMRAADIADPDAAVPADPSFEVVAGASRATRAAAAADFDDSEPAFRAVAPASAAPEPAPGTAPVVRTSDRSAAEIAAPRPAREASAVPPARAVGSDPAFRRREDADGGSDEPRFQARP
jgi:hypothetical protein